MFGCGDIIAMPYHWRHDRSILKTYVPIHTVFIIFPTPFHFETDTFALVFIFPTSTAQSVDMLCVRLAEKHDDKDMIKHG